MSNNQEANTAPPTVEDIISSQGVEIQPSQTQGGYTTNSRQLEDLQRTVITESAQSKIVTKKD